MMTDTLPDVAFYQGQGLSFFPLPHGQKYDADFKWGKFQQRRPTDAEVRHWFGNGSKHNIAVVCGKVSGGLVVLDCDNEERFWELSAAIKAKTDLDVLSLSRVSRTGKGFHIWILVDEPVASAKFPRLDIKAEGGYVVAPPSLHPEGAEYHWLNPEAPIHRIATLKDIGIDLDQQRGDSQPEHGDNWVTEALKGIGEGGRNDICYRLASYFRNKHPQDITEALLLDWNKRNSPPLDTTEVIRTIKSAYSRPLDGDIDNIRVYTYKRFSSDSESNRDKTVTDSVTLSQRIGDFVTGTTGWFSYEEIDKELGLLQQRDKDNRRQIVRRLKAEGIIEAHPKNNKLLRHVNVAVRLVDFKTAGLRAPLAVKYPFAVETYFNTFPGNVIVLAGAADAGKTAFLLNFIRLNMYDFSIFYQTSEMGEAELASRLEKFEGITLDEWNFTAEERSRDYADVIRPDCVNIIDYMELAGDFYNVSEYLKQIHDRLGGGIAIVALQKKRNAELGRGGDFGLEKPRLYLTMDMGKITIQKAKNWVDPEFNPNGLRLNFKLVAGCKFIVTEDWHYEQA